MRSRLTVLTTATSLSRCTWIFDKNGTNDVYQRVPTKIGNQKWVVDSPTQYGTIGFDHHGQVRPRSPLQLLETTAAQLLRHRGRAKGQEGGGVAEALPQNQTKP